MNERIGTALGAMAALVLLGTLLYPGAPEPPTRPTTVEAGRNGYAALARWLEVEGVRVHSLRERMDTLVDGKLGFPAAGNLLITTMPHSTRLRLEESLMLRSWIRAGNTLLVMAALDDTPDWSANVDTGNFLQDLQRLSGLVMDVPPDDSLPDQIGSLTGTSTVILQGLRAHPLMHDVDTLHGESDFPASLWRARPEDEGRAVLQLARVSGYGMPALWQVPLQEGAVLVSALGSALTNRALGQGRNRVWVRNLVRHHLGPGGVVVFDDMHQGLSALYDPDAFFRDPRLGTTVLFVLGLWALYLLGTSSRLAPLRERRPAPGQVDFVAGVGGFLARKLSRGDAARLLMEGWFDELRRRGLAPAGGAPPWQALGALSAVRAPVLARLRAQHEAAVKGAAVDLRDVHNTIEELRRMLR